MNQGKKVNYIIIFLWLCSFRALFSLDYYMSAGAGSGGDGSLLYPFATFIEARDYLRIETNLMMSEDIVVHLSGEFRLDTPIIFHTEDGGKNGYTITYRNAQNKTALVLGGRYITAWNIDTANVYRANVMPGSRTSLFENNRSADLRLTRGDLIQPGTFCFEGNTLYYYPRNLPIQDQDILLPSATNLIQLEGDSEANPIENLRFEGLVFSGTAYDPLSTGRPGEEQALFTIRNGIRITLQGCKILNAGGTALLLDKYAREIDLNYNRIDGFGGHGISLSGLVSGDSAYDVPVLSAVNRDNSIMANLITNGGYRQRGSAGIRLYQSGDNLLEGNYLSNIDGSGVILSGLASPSNTGGNIVRSNRIFRITADDAASAGVYAGNTGNNNTVEQNLIYQLRNDTVGYAIAGIFPDSGSRDILVQKNAVYQVVDGPGSAAGLKLAGRNLTVQNNIFADNEPIHDVLYLNGGGNLTGLRLNNNIFYTPGGLYYHYFVNQEFPASFLVQENVIYHPGGSTSIYMPPKGQQTFNQWYASAIVDRGSIVNVDPLFEEPAVGLYQLKAASLVPDSQFEELDFRTPGLPSSFVYRYATDRTEGEKYNACNGVLLQQALVRAAGGGSWLQYSSLYFANNVHSMTIRYASNAPVGSAATLNIRRDDKDGTSLGSAPVPGTGGPDQFRFLTLPVTAFRGTCDLYLVFTDGNGQNIRLDWFKFSVISEVEPPPPKQPPYLEIVSPLEGTRVAEGQAITVEARAEDTDGSVTQIDLEVNGVLKTTVYSSRILYTLDKLRAGKYTLLVRAIDNEDLESTRSVGITVGSPSEQLPVVSLLEPFNGQVFAGSGNISVRAAASGGSSPVDEVQFFFNGLMLFIDKDAPYQYTWQNVQPGEYRVEAKVVNTAGYFATQEITIIVDNSEYILAHWKLDEYGGRIAADSSVNKYDGTVSNAFGVNGVNDGAFDFPGNGEIITGVPVVRNLPQFTMAGWIRPRSFAARVGLWGQNDTMEFGFMGNGVLHLYTASGAAITAPYHFPLNEWHHVAVMGDGQNIKLYLDGSLRATNATSVNSYSGESGNSFNIGAKIFDNDGNYFDGLIDDVIVYSRAITDYEVRFLARRNGNFQPVVRIITPANGSRLQGPTNILIQVEASDEDSGVRVVEYFANGDFIGSSSQFPYSYNWTGVAPGVYSLQARVTDNTNATTTTQLSFTVEDQELIAYWSFDERSDRIVYDLSANHNNGSISNGIPDDGLYQGALRFQGNGSIISSYGMLNNLPSFTIAGWIKPAQAGYRIGLWGQDGVVEFGFMSENTLYLWVTNGISCDASYPYPMNEWHHVAISGDGEAIRIYLDGKQVAIKMMLTASYGSSDWTFNLAGDGIFDTYGNFYTGMLDEVYVYRRALSAQELLTLVNYNPYDLPEVRFTNLYEGQILYYPFTQQVLTEVVRTENCAAGAVEFFLNQQPVFRAEGAPYGFLWDMKDEPQEKLYQLKARLTTACGIWDEAVINLELQPGTQPPIEGNPGEENPGSEDPGSEEPGGEIPGGENPDEQTPGEENSWVDTGFGLPDLFGAQADKRGPVNREFLSLDFSGRTDNRIRSSGGNSAIYYPGVTYNNTNRSPNSSSGGNVLRTNNNSANNPPDSSGASNPGSADFVYETSDRNRTTQPGFSRISDFGEITALSVPATEDSLSVQEREEIRLGGVTSTTDKRDPGTPAAVNDPLSPDNRSDLTPGGDTTNGSNPIGGGNSWVYYLIVLLLGVLALLIILLNRRKRTIQH